MKSKKNNYFILIIICIILLCILGIIYFSEEQEEILETPTKNNYILLNDYSRFFTIESCVDKYINLLSSDKSDSLLEVLDSDYIKSNNITTDNIYNYVNKLDGIYSFKSKKIYYEEISKNFTKYYVYGYLIKEEMDSKGIKSDYYLIINLDLKNNLFSVLPYDGAMFKEVSNG